MMSSLELFFRIFIIVEETGYESRRASKTDVFVLIFALSRDRDSAHLSNDHGVRRVVSC